MPFSSNNGLIRFDIPNTYRGTCRIAFDLPVGISMLGGSPLVFSDNGVIEHFRPGIRSRYTSTSKTCHNASGIVAAAVVPRSSDILLSTRSGLDVLREDHHGGSQILRSSLLATNPRNQIESIALDNNGTIATAFVSNLTERELEFFSINNLRISPSRKGLRLNAINAPITALAFNRQGGVMVFDKSGAITEVALEPHGGAAKVTRQIHGSLTGLAPNRDKPHGRRPLIVDKHGHIFAATDRVIAVFDSNQTGNVAPLRTCVVGDSDDYIDGVAIDGAERLFVLTHSVTGDEAPVISVYSVRDLMSNQRRPRPLKRDVVNTNTL